jgi:hypothetical protein
MLYSTNIKPCFAYNIFCFLPYSLLSQEAPQSPIITDRPDFTESTDIVPKGKYQAEFGYTFNKFDKTESHSFRELLIRIPLHQKIDSTWA